MVKKFGFSKILGGEQINIICAMHGIKVNSMNSKPMGEDFDKDTEAPFGTVPWMKDHSNGLELNDSMAIVQYLVTKYDGPLTPSNPEDAARLVLLIDRVELTLMIWLGKNENIERGALIVIVSSLIYILLMNFQESCWLRILL